MPLPPVVVLAVERGCRVRIADALRGRGIPHFCSAGREVVALVRETSPSVVVVELRDAAGFSTAPVVATLRRDYPSIPVLAYCGLTQAEARDMFLAARAGASSVMLRGVDDERTMLERCLARAADDSVRDRVMRALLPRVPVSVAPFVDFCFMHGRRAFAITEAADALGVHRKTLVNRLSVAGWPTPTAVAGWVRILIAASLMEDPGRTVERVALDVGLPSAAALRNMLRRRTGLRPAEVRLAGGLACVLAIFRDRVAGSPKSTREALVATRVVDASARAASSRPPAVRPYADAKVAGQAGR
ncbi:MAG: hypothetical protein NVS9B3_15250 [Gemmatimonadaceae bacterium]